MNKRLLPRLRRRLKLTLGGKLPAFTADVSPQGFAAEVMHVLRPGTQVHGAITLNGQEFPFTGQVAWAKAGEPRLSVRGRYGVRFTGISNAFFELFASTWRTPQ
jgi:hypothetical protein